MRFFGLHFICAILVCVFFRGHNCEYCSSQIKQFPFLASLHYDGNRTCAATIVTRYLAVTAATCVYGKLWMKFTLVFGTSSGDYTENAENSRAIFAIEHHPRFNPKSGDFDVAVVAFEKLLFNSTVKPIKFSYKPVYPGPVITGGWGLVDHANDTDPESCENSFNLVKTNLMDIRKCRTFYSRARPISLTRNLCTEPNSPYSCHADDGSPLVSVDIGAGLGIASNLGNCPQPELPSVFINIHANGIKQFIESMMNKYNHYTPRSSRDRGKNQADDVKGAKASHPTTSAPSTSSSTEKDDEYDYNTTKNFKKKLQFKQMLN